MRLFHGFVAVFAIGVVTIAGFALLGGSTRVPNVVLPVATKQLPSLAPLPLPVNLSISDIDRLGNNVTREFAGEVGKDIVVRNPDGPATIEDKQWISVLEPNQAVETLIADGIKNFNAKDFIPDVPRASLRIAVVPASVYFRGFQDILQHNFGSVAVDLASESLTGIGDLIVAYDRAIKIFYDTEVPEDLVAVHQREIQLLTAQKKIFEAIAGYQDDPLRAILANELLQKVTDDFGKLKNTIAEYIKDKQINI